jgi:hypothetical protein
MIALMKIEVDENLSPFERKKFIFEFQIKYYFEKKGSLRKTANELSINYRTLRFYLKKNPEFKKGLNIKYIDRFKNIRIILLNMFKDNEHVEEIIEIFIRNKIDNPNMSNQQIILKIKEMLADD